MSLSEATSTAMPREPFRRVSSPRTKSDLAAMAISRAGDEQLWKLHDQFVFEYASLLALDTPEMQQGTLSAATPKQKRAYKAWEKQLAVCDSACRAVYLSPANTVHGMLMKIHIAGFALECSGRTFSAPYHGKDVATGCPQAWTPHPVFMDNDEANLIVSIRRDLHALRDGTPLS